MSVFVVMWEMLTALEKGASAFESWRGRAEDLETVIEIGSKKKVMQAERQDQDNGIEKGVVEE